MSRSVLVLVQDNFVGADPVAEVLGQQPALHPSGIEHAHGAEARHRQRLPAFGADDPALVEAHQVVHGHAGQAAGVLLHVPAVGFDGDVDVAVVPHRRRDVVGLAAGVHFHCDSGSHVFADCSNLMQDIGSFLHAVHPGSLVEEPQSGPV